MKNFHTSKVEKILQNFTIVRHLSRQKCAISTILAMIKTRNVQLQELGLHLNDEAKPASNERRLQSFFKDAVLEEEEVTFLLSVFLLFGKIELCMDRTEWSFGKKEVNILVISAYCQGIGLPLYVELLNNNSGNSNTVDRIHILKK